MMAIVAANARISAAQRRMYAGGIGYTMPRADSAKPAGESVDGG